VVEPCDRAVLRIESHHGHQSLAHSFGHITKLLYGKRLRL
jgi:hypothetical protein